MGESQSNLADLPKNGEDVAARCRQQCDELRKPSYWIIRQSDERIAKTHERIDRTKERLRAAGVLPPESQPESEPDPFLEWGKLLIPANGNSKCRADD